MYHPYRAVQVEITNLGQKCKVPEEICQEGGVDAITVATGGKCHRYCYCWRKMLSLQLLPSFANGFLH
ncbi:hypothetical protein GW17_00058938 [Ensete ventricosum]|nr:hypothetical protein GW17_00058938 [Ensete ventricosum]